MTSVHGAFLCAIALLHVARLAAADLQTTPDGAIEFVERTLIFPQRIGMFMVWANNCGNSTLPLVKVVATFKRVSSFRRDIKDVRIYCGQICKQIDQAGSIQELAGCNHGTCFKPVNASATLAASNAPFKTIKQVVPADKNKTLWARDEDFLKVQRWNGSESISILHNFQQEVGVTEESVCFAILFATNHYSKQIKIHLSSEWWSKEPSTSAAAESALPIASSLPDTKKIQDYQEWKLFLPCMTGAGTLALLTVWLCHCNCCNEQGPTDIGRG